MENVISGAGAGNIMERSKDTNNMSIQTRYTEQVYTIHNICKTKSGELSCASHLGTATLAELLAKLPIVKQIK